MKMARESCFGTNLPLSSMPPQLIVMLTHNDRTVENALEVFNSSQDAPVTHWGFKDRGLSVDAMKRLAAAIKDAGKIACLEVVRYSTQACLESAKLALACGFDYLMGTVYCNAVASLLRGKPIKYMPFCGRVSGSPSVLEGSISEIIAHGRDIAGRGAHGFDLLAYRYRGNPEKLARQFVDVIDLPVVIAGSIASFTQLDKIKEIAPWGFTIGSAFFEGKFGDLSIPEQIRSVTDHMNSQTRHTTLSTRNVAPPLSQGKRER